jgi:uncharacterized protein YjbJ (UPF0337 family)
MATEHVRGTVNKVKGAVKEAVGKLTGSKRMQAEGKLDKAKGTARPNKSDQFSFPHSGRSSGRPIFVS